jgi:hypothetical protein
MDLLTEIFLTATKMLTLFIGISGFFLSVALLFRPQAVRRMSEKVNSSVSFFPISPLLDRRIETNRIAYRHPLWVGGLFIAGSIFVLHFLYFQFSMPSVEAISALILFEVLVLISKLAAFCGLLLGAALLAVPSRVRALEDRAGAWIDTQPFFQGLDRSNTSVDHIFLRYPLASGAVGLLASFILTVLSIYNLSIF